ncbi:methyl-accepting chemotaxis protein [Salipiger sp. IMCC34102]|uniref:methyl-accepting chemotaxis protein n=1 Tax=Salipiger sp. IMCC34102 TaxID=2510647 RepID=UPI001F5E143F|nr:methyl-accepting chemotaxis protein [Salipiger sp. IMCC34102]
MGRAVDASHAVIWFDIDGTILEANARFLSLFGYDASDLTGYKHSLLVSSEEAQDPGYTAFWHALSKGDPQRGLFGRLAKDGSRIWVETDYIPVTGAGDVVTRVVAFSSEVGAARLRSAEAALQLDALSAAEAFVEFDLTGRILTANGNFLTMTGCALSELEGRPHGERMGETEAKDLWDRLSAGESLLEEIACRGAKGEVRIELKYAPVLDADGVPYKVVGLARDISQEIAAIEYLSDGLKALAGGDLGIRIPETVGGRFAGLRDAVDAAIVALGRLVSDIRDSTDRIAEETDVIAGSVQNLSARNEQQAARVEETSAAMTEMEGTIQSNAENTQTATDRAAKAVCVAETGHDIVSEAITSMKEIEESARNISKVNEMIDAIAFQTNLLALNAGVEAARAGEAGRGFGVVASEVRALAQRATDAAHDINELVQKSHKAVTHGSDLVTRSGEALSEIVTSVSAFADNMRDVSNATSEQAQGISSVRQAISEIDITTQRNAAIAEESAAAAMQLAQRGTRLRKLVSGFRGGNVHAFTPKGDKPSNPSANQGGDTTSSAPQAEGPTAAAGGWADF